MGVCSNGRFYENDLENYIHFLIQEFIVNLRVRQCIHSESKVGFDHD